MAIIKNHLKENFSIVPNEIITAKSLNDGEYRLLLYFYHLPTNWEVNQEHLAKEFDLSREQINRRLSSLKNKGYLEINKKKINKNQWEYDYILNIPIVTKMSHQQMSHQQMSHQQMSHQQMSQPNNTNNITILNNIKEKEINKEKEKYFEDEELNKKYHEYLQMRIEKKCKATPTTIKNQINRLNKYDKDTALEMIQNSIDNGWQGIFELKNRTSSIEKPFWEEKEIKTSSGGSKEIDEILKVFN